MSKELVREAYNWGTPPARLAELASDPRADIFMPALKNPKTPVECLHEGLRGTRQRAAAENPNTPPGVLRSWVSGIIRDPQGALHRYGPIPQLLEAIFANPNLPVDVWEMVFSANTDTRVYRAAVISKHCPPEVLLLGAVCKDPVTQERALLNPRCPEEAAVAVRLQLLSRGSL